MKQALISISLIGVLFMAGMKEPLKTELGAEQTAAIQKAVLKSHQEMIEALEKLDVDGFFEFIIDSGKGAIVQDGNLMTVKESLAQTKKGLEGVTKLEYEFSREIVKVLSPQIALFVGQGRSTVTRDTGDTFIRDFAVTSVFVLKDGKWKIVHGHHSTFPRQ